MILPTFSKKTHEIEKILGREGGGRAPGAPPLDSPLYNVHHISKFFNITQQQQIYARDE